jgi:DeoR family fructose operon transcriptional repressor
MLPAKRQNDIRQIMLERKQIDVQTLANLLNVTEVTIRKDLEKLEEDNFLTRTHGGAILKSETSSYPSSQSLFAVPSDEDAEKYNNIASIASGFVKDNSSIFLGPGYSCAALADYLNSRKNVSVMTTDIRTACQFSWHCPNVMLLIPGGQINPDQMQLSGNLVMNTLSSFYFDAAFFDIDGITLSRGYSVGSLEEALMIQFVIPRSKENYALCNYKNFNVESNAFVGGIDLFHAVVTNEHAPDEFKEYYFKHNVRLYATINAN